jgi:hypothetical protein
MGMQEFSILDFTEEELGIYCSRVSEDPKGCSNPVVSTDTIGLTWCEEHRERGAFIDLGKRLGWPACECQPYYAMAEGSYFWITTATQGDDDRLYTLMFAADALESEGKVA